MNEKWTISFVGANGMNLQSIDEKEQTPKIIAAALKQNKESIKYANMLIVIKALNNYEEK